MHRTQSIFNLSPPLQNFRSEMEVRDLTKTLLVVSARKKYRALSEDEDVQSRTGTNTRPITGMTEGQFEELFDIGDVLGHGSHATVHR